jgi:hypothetical protein
VSSSTLNTRLLLATSLLLAGAAFLAGCSSAPIIAADQTPTVTLQPVAACSTPPQDHPAGAYIWAIPAMGASNQNGVAQTCGLGFHPHSSITLSLARYNSTIFTPIPNLDVKADGQGAFSTAIAVGANWICLNLRIRADDGQGASATTRLAPGGTSLPENAQPAGCPAPPRIP